MRIELDRVHTSTAGTLEAESDPADACEEVDEAERGLNGLVARVRRERSGSLPSIFRDCYRQHRPSASVNPE